MTDLSQDAAADETSVFTEVTIEEVVETVVVPPDEISLSSKTAFKDQMRKSFLAFEQKLVDAKHQTDNEDYDEEIVIEEESIVHDDEVTSAEESKDKLENFQSEMRKSFAAFEALLGDNELDEATENNDDDDDDDGMYDETFDEVTVEETGIGPQQQDTNKVADADSVKVSGPVNQTAKKVGTSKEQRKEEEMKEFQNEMRKSFTAFESLLLKQSKSENEEEEDEEEESCVLDEYTVEEIVDQTMVGEDDSKDFAMEMQSENKGDEEEENADSCVTDEYTVEEIVVQTTAGEDDSKLFDKEMQKSFSAFESFLKQNNDASSSKEDESVWEEEPIQKTSQGSAAALTVEAPVTPKITNDASPSSPAASVHDSDKTCEDGISKVGEGSGPKHDDDPVSDANKEKSQMQTTQSQQQPSHNHSLQEEKKDDDCLLQKTQNRVDDTGDKVAFDKGKHTENNTKQEEALLGEMRAENVEKMESASNDLPKSLPSSPTENSEGPELILTKPDPKTSSPPTKKFTHQPEAPSEVNGKPLPIAGEPKAKEYILHKLVGVFILALCCYVTIYMDGGNDAVQSSQSFSEF